jgi:hypothetical protein
LAEAAESIKATLVRVIDNGEFKSLIDQGIDQLKTSAEAVKQPTSVNVQIQGAVDRTRVTHPRR